MNTTITTSIDKGYTTIAMLPKCKTACKLLSKQNPQSLLSVFHDGLVGGEDERDYEKVSGMEVISASVEVFNNYDSIAFAADCVLSDYDRMAKLHFSGSIDINEDDPDCPIYCHMDGSRWTNGGRSYEIKIFTYDVVDSVDWRHDHMKTDSAD